MKNILIPFDFSRASLNALDYAVEFITKEPSILLYLLHIKADGDNEEELQKKMNKIISEYKDTSVSKIKTLICSGKLIPTILNYREELEIDLVIMGTKGAALDEDDIPTRTSKFVQEANLPVLVIPEDASKFKLGTIILTLGKEKIADKDALYTLLDVSRRFGAEVHILTIKKDKATIGYSEDDEQNENILQYFLENFYSHRSFLENEDIEKGIMEYLETHDADMLAIMPNTHLDSGKASRGELTRILTLHTKTPLLVLD
ncbi:universal stress protein [Salegentibacter sp. F188]|uniref:Universal stress protein n=1 Tax=Autumnicola patrickiae TaxID=3075591 RepID=A0ABU3E4R0_9FLAO|nr:universal stress protein [Salegentibacter sp. F188]MDT0690986.1 universal stress protein [Salegentibacter sp. F188]